MEEKISVERPRPFSSGYRIPFYETNAGVKKPFHTTLETTSAEILRDHRRLALHTADSGDIAALDAFALETLLQKNARWFKNDLPEESIRAMFQPSKNPDGFAMFRFSPDHFPKRFYINDRAVADWDDMENQWLKRHECVVERVVADVVCYGIYLKKQQAELLWKIDTLSVYLHEPATIGRETNIDEYKEDIENEWEAHLGVYSRRMEEEIRLLESRIKKKREKRQQLVETLARCRRLGTGDPEWNTSIEYLRREIHLQDS
jgi:hypothetical protein